MFSSAYAGWQQSGTQCPGFCPETRGGLRSPGLRGQRQSAGVRRVAGGATAAAAALGFDCRSVCSRPCRRQTAAQSWVTNRHPSHKHRLPAAHSSTMMCTAQPTLGSCQGVGHRLKHVSRQCRDDKQARWQSSCRRHEQEGREWHRVRPPAQHSEAAGAAQGAEAAHQVCAGRAALCPGSPDADCRLRSTHSTQTTAPYLCRRQSICQPATRATAGSSMCRGHVVANAATVGAAMPGAA